MFTVLKILPPAEPSSRFFFLRRRKPHSPALTRVAVRGGAFFYTLTMCPDRHGRLPFAAVPESCLRRVLLTDGSVLPLESPVRLFAPSVLPLTVFLHTAVDFLKRAADDPHARTIGILDPQAALQQGIEQFIPHAKTIRVFTQSPEKYACVCESLVRAWGVAPVVSLPGAAMRACDYVIAPYAPGACGTQGTLYMKQGGGVTLCGSGVLLPPEIEARRPADTNPLLFAAALYELCNITELKTLSYDRFVPIKTGAIY